MVLGYGLSFFTALDLDALCAFPGGRLHPINQGNRKEKMGFLTADFLYRTHLLQERLYYIQNKFSNDTGRHVSPSDLVYKSQKFAKV